MAIYLEDKIAEVEHLQAEVKRLRSIIQNVLAVPKVTPEPMSEKLEIGAVLTYDSLGNTSTGGQQVGADGSGTFAELFYGDPESAEAAARAKVSALIEAGYRLREVHIVVDEESYYGRFICHTR